MPEPDYAYSNVQVELADGIAWLMLNRPHKRNAMSPALNAEMADALVRLEGDDRARVVVLTGVGDAFSAGMDLQEYFRDVDADHPAVQIHVRRVNAEWQWKHLMNYSKPTIAMVNGWCFGGLSPRSWPATSPSRPTTRRSVSPRSTGASRRAAW